ncbi:uncharacterized protein LOC111697700 [Eurytemora carolleeae]|uniref:uncharacterized protein LOC111697700 n=1 Tax=Eurytemora carolleeae TaxID=1294199 RepID=UPI000C792140|nr:uncharacterized protein LOC111697700 [Eurytemora carolleeae]XP_023323561.1 uncharacterized protein LOC111697700 [Eurytemora carolleeae]|eukprot:XP_023323560.1 uncharacterized protein LOC111697700 [Eurytemora affinis]
MRIGLLVQILLLVAGVVQGLDPISLSALSLAEITAVGSVVAMLGFKLFAHSAQVLRLTGRIKRSEEDDLNYATIENIAALEPEKDDLNYTTIDTIAALEPEDCFKRVFCSAATGRFKNEGLKKTLNIVYQAILIDPSNINTENYKQAAIFGASRRDIEKCEYKYACALSMDKLELLY